MSIILKATNLHKSFLIGGQSVKIINKVNLEINKGDFISIMGRSGSGKTTLLHLLSGLTTPDVGAIEIDGKDIASFREKDSCNFRLRNMGIVFQENNLISHFNVEENIILPFLVANEKIDDEFLDELLKLTNLEEHRYHDVSKLSGGQCQKVAIARAIIAKPKIIFADEPTGSLDMTSALEIMQLFKKLNELYKITIVQVTHSIECAKFGSVIINLLDGKIVNTNEVDTI